MVVKQPTYEHRNSPVVPIKREGCQGTSEAALPILKQTPAASGVGVEEAADLTNTETR